MTESQFNPSHFDEKEVFFSVRVVLKVLMQSDTQPM